MKENNHSIEATFLESFDQLSDQLFRHVYFRISDREVAKDIVQEVFLKIWKEIQKGTSIDNMNAFSYRIAQNMVIDYYRKTKSSSLDSLLDEGFDPQGSDESDILVFAELSLTMDALNQLSPQDRSALVMRYVDGFSPKEIASLSGESENVISVRIHRAKQRLQSIIGNE